MALKLAAFSFVSAATAVPAISFFSRFKDSREAGARSVVDSFVRDCHLLVRDYRRLFRVSPVPVPATEVGASLDGHNVNPSGDSETAETAN